MSFFRIRPRQFDTAIQAFGATHGGLTTGQQSALEFLLRELRGSLQWSHVLALYPFIGDTFNRQKLNLKASGSLPLVAVNNPTVDAVHGLNGAASDYATLTLPASETGILRIYLRWRNAAVADTTPILTTNTGLEILQGVDGPGTFGLQWSTDEPATARIYQVWPYDTARGHRSLELVLDANEGLVRIRAGGSESYWHTLDGHGDDPLTLPLQFTFLASCTHQLSFLAFLDNDDAPDAFGRIERAFCRGLGRDEAAARHDVQLWSDGTTRLGSDGQPLLQSNP